MKDKLIKLLPLFGCAGYVTDVDGYDELIISSSKSENQVVLAPHISKNDLMSMMLYCRYIQSMDDDIPSIQVKDFVEWYYSNDAKIDFNNLAIQMIDLVTSEDDNVKVED